MNVSSATHANSVAMIAAMSNRSAKAVKPAGPPAPAPAPKAVNSDGDTDGGRLDVTA